LAAAVLLALTSPCSLAQSNTSYGTGALNSVTSGGSNSAFGYHSLYSTTSGGYNTGIGAGALSANTTGIFNVATGTNALLYNTTGESNCAFGLNTLVSNTTSSYNSAFGTYALTSNTGAGNVALGFGALGANGTGDYNVASGLSALGQNTTGTTNIGIGFQAGYNLTTGDNNIDIGNLGVADESDTIRIGDQNTQTATFVAGIYGATATDGVAVYINADGQLGTNTSSRRFKRDIEDMADSSEAIHSLRPVSFRYNEQLDSKGVPHYGLIAEEVAEVSPDLVQRNAKGEIYTVRYEAVNAMLLNEFQKEHRRVQEQETMITRQQEQLRKLAEVVNDLQRKMDGKLYGD
ncbi:MAG: tail fiber domain-containing protein, partial [Chthoniobacteraceae bacterium]